MAAVIGTFVFEVAGEKQNALITGATGKTNNMRKTSKPASETTNKPAHEIRVNGIRATIRASQTEKGVRYNTTFERSYRDGESES